MSPSEGINGPVQGARPFSCAGSRASCRSMSLRCTADIRLWSRASRLRATRREFSCRRAKWNIVLRHSSRRGKSLRRTHSDPSYQASFRLKLPARRSRQFACASLPSSSKHSNDVRFLLDFTKFVRTNRTARCDSNQSIMITSRHETPTIRTDDLRGDLVMHMRAAGDLIGDAMVVRPDGAVRSWARTGAGPLVRLRRDRARTRLRLYCLPYAGGSASVFRSWCDLLPPNVDVWGVEYPGHGSRIKIG